MPGAGGIGWEWEWEWEPEGRDGVMELMSQLLLCMESLNVRMSNERMAGRMACVPTRE
jgi:hypothetical protein